MDGIDTMDAMDAVDDVDAVDRGDDRGRSRGTLGFLRLGGAERGSRGWLDHLAGMIVSVR
jgi:hypothetical protein